MLCLSLQTLYNLLAPHVEDVWACEPTVTNQTIVISVYRSLVPLALRDCRPAHAPAGTGGVPTPTSHPDNFVCVFVSLRTSFNVIQSGSSSPRP